MLAAGLATQDAALAHDAADHRTRTDQFKPASAADGSRHATFASERILATFQVDGDELIGPNVSTRHRRQALKIWERFVELIPAEYRTMVSGFELRPRNFSGAYVYQDYPSTSNWILGMGKGFTGKELDFILIHEFAHLLTLNAEEVSPEIPPELCDTYFPYEGCSTADSFLNRFVDRFWPDKVLRKNRRAVNQGTLFDFWYPRRRQFVTAYAATNPGEDIAETFAYFVTRSKPAPKKVAKKKMLFFWDDTEMVALRKRIRSA